MGLQTFPLIRMSSRELIELQGIRESLVSWVTVEMYLVFPCFAPSLEMLKVHCRGCEVALHTRICRYVAASIGHIHHLMKLIRFCRGYGHTAAGIPF